MEITYYSHSCFKIKGKEGSVVIDPYDSKLAGYKLPKLDADMVLCSHDHYDHNFIEGVTGYKFAATTPGEYETKDIYVEGIPTFHDEVGGTKRGRNIMFQIQMEDFTVLHMGDIGHELSKETLERLVEVDVLLIPVGGVYTIDAVTASKVISSIEPGIVVPMHYRKKDTKGDLEKLDLLDKFLDEMGVDKVNEVEKLKINSRQDIPEETEVIVIKPAN